MIKVGWPEIGSTSDVDLWKCNDSDRPLYIEDHILHLLRHLRSPSPSYQVGLNLNHAFHQATAFSCFGLDCGYKCLACSTRVSGSKQTQMILQDSSIVRVLYDGSLLTL